MPAKVRKAVIPAAGLGTRFLPATKAMPKEMLSIVDVPTIQLVIEEAVAAGIRDIVIINGRNKSSIEDHFDHAYELVAHIRAHRDFGLAVAGYPEKHIEAPDLATDLGHLTRKIDAGGDIVITQLFYDNADYYRFVEEARKTGIDVPIVPGLLPIQSFGQIKRIASLCGSKIPDTLHDELDAAEHDSQAVKDIGVRWAVEQCKDLLAQGAPGIHFYVLNRAKHMERICGELF